MNNVQQETEPNQQGRWIYAYFLLAAFDVLTVAFTLYLNHQLMGLYNESIEVNQQWAQRQGRYAELGELASETNAPGNDVFDSRDVKAEKARLEQSFQLFRSAMNEARADLASSVEAEFRPEISSSLEHVDDAMAGMLQEAGLIFGYFDNRQEKLAGSRMATMDRRYAELNRALATLGRQAREIQKQKLSAQQQMAERLRKFEYAIGGLILIMVLSITIYGHSMIRHTRESWKRLERSERRMSQIFGHAENGMALVSHSGVVQLMNPAAEKMTGVSTADARGRNFGDLFAGAAVPESDEATALEVQITRGSGDVVELSMMFGAPGAGESDHRVVSFSDITQRKQIQLAAEAARKAAEDAAAAKAGFVASMSHEIRTPLNAVIGAISLLRGSDLKPDQKEDVEILRVGSENLLSIVNNVLDYSKIEAGKMDLDPVDFSLHQCLIDVGKLFSRKALESGVRLVWAYDPDVPDRVHGDLGRIRQVLSNLVGNALKFNHRGLVELYAEPVQQSETEVEVCLMVRDTGIGMSADALANLFEAFSQASVSTSTKYGGTGLGLSISKTLVELMGGRIDVQSVEGKGTKFQIFLTLGIPVSEPKTGAGAEQLPASVVPERQEVGELKVLVCDDNPVNRSIAGKMLQRLGHSVDMAINGHAAVESASRVKYDLILMDLNFPDMDGVQAAQMIRSQSGPSQGARVVAFSAHLSREDEARFAAVGVTECLHKPMAIEELENLLS